MPFRVFNFIKMNNKFYFRSLKATLHFVFEMKLNCKTLFRGFNFISNFKKAESQCKNVSYYKVWLVVYFEKVSYYKVWFVVYFENVSYYKVWLVVYFENVEFFK
jgi:hypothetical protein